MTVLTFWAGLIFPVGNCPVYSRMFSSIPVSTCRCLEQLALLVTIKNVIRVSECTGVYVCMCVCVCMAKLPPFENHCSEDSKYSKIVGM